LLGGNGYTTDYPIARLYRDAQVLTVWEGPANIQALELLRLLAPKYAGAQMYDRRMRDIISGIPNELSRLVKHRLDDDLAAVAIATRDKASSIRYARKLLHRLSESLAFGLVSEAAASSEDPLHSLGAIRYFEEIEPPKIGEGNQQVANAQLQLIEGMLGDSHALAVP
jgi:hypothetical protein